MNLMLAVGHYTITIFILERTPTRLPWVVEIGGFIGFSYLMIRVVNEGENSLQRSCGYLGAYIFTLLFLWSIFCYAFIQAGFPGCN